MMTYDETMDYGAGQYSDVIDALGDVGLPAMFAQTGGMNAALIVTLEAGYWLLITDAEDSLSWERDTHEGWYVGLYPPGEGGQQPIRYEETEASDLASLLRLLDAVLKTPTTPIH
jgi:hypothetical protein